MNFPETDLTRVRRSVDARNEEIGEHLDEIRVEVDVNAKAITILECRPPWVDDAGEEWIRQEVARFRFTKATGAWTLYWPDRHSRFHAYDRVKPTPNVQRLLDEIDADPTHIFWG